MKNDNQEQEVEHKEDGSTTSSALAGLLIGGLAGASAALLLAPQSGKETREQIHQKTIELRDRTAETVEDAVAQVKSKTHQITSGVLEKVEEVQQHSQDLLVEQLDHVSAVVEAGKAALAPQVEKKAAKRS